MRFMIDWLRQFGFGQQRPLSLDDRKERLSEFKSSRNRALVYLALFFAVMTQLWRGSSPELTDVVIENFSAVLCSGLVLMSALVNWLLVAQRRVRAEEAAIAQMGASAVDSALRNAKPQWTPEFISSMEVLVANIHDLASDELALVTEIDNKTGLLFLGRLDKPMHALEPIVKLIADALEQRMQRQQGIRVQVSNIDVHDFMQTMLSAFKRIAQNWGYIPGQDWKERVAIDHVDDRFINYQNRLLQWLAGILVEYAKCSPQQQARDLDGLILSPAWVKEGDNDIPGVKYLVEQYREATKVQREIHFINVLAWYAANKPELVEAESVYDAAPAFVALTQWQYKKNVQPNIVSNEVHTSFWKQRASEHSREIVTKISQEAVSTTASGLS